MGDEPAAGAVDADDVRTDAVGLGTADRRVGADEVRGRGNHVHTTGGDRAAAEGVASRVQHQAAGVRGTGGSEGRDVDTALRVRVREVPLALTGGVRHGSEAFDSGRAANVVEHTALVVEAPVIAGG